MALAGCLAPEPRILLLPEPRDPASDLLLRIDPLPHIVRADEEITLDLELVNVGPVPILVAVIDDFNLDLPFYTGWNIGNQACVKARAVTELPRRPPVFVRG